MITKTYLFTFTFCRSVLKNCIRRSLSMCSTCKNVMDKSCIKPYPLNHSILAPPMFNQHLSLFYIFTCTSIAAYEHSKTKRRYNKLSFFLFLRGKVWRALFYQILVSCIKLTHFQISLSCIKIEELYWQVGQPKRRR